jgi:hypothetical protein
MNEREKKSNKILNKSRLQNTMPAIEIWEERGILGYENDSGAYSYSCKCPQISHSLP